MTQELIIYDSSYFKTVTKNALMDGTCIVLYETYYNMYKNPHNYQILQDELLELIQTKRLIIESVPSLYQQTTERDKIISLALLKSSDYEVTVYTKDEKLALDLLLNDIHVQNRDFAHLFTNIGKSEEKEDIFVYDTSTLLQYMNKIDFSKNFHYLFTCVLEELLFTKPHTDHSPLFKMLYILNTYPDHVKIIPTVSSTQQKGRYSSTDFLILCSTIYAKNQEKNRRLPCLLLITNCSTRQCISINFLLLVAFLILMIFLLLLLTKKSQFREKLPKLKLRQLLIHLLTKFLQMKLKKNQIQKFWIPF